VIPLSRVRKIYIEFNEGFAKNAIAQNQLAADLQSTNLLTVSKDRDEADALLEIRIHHKGPGPADQIRSDSKISITARLLNANGSVIWPDQDNKIRNYRGRLVDAFRQLTRDLAGDIENGDKK
jgi:hypothetical protein